jgi:sugar transferase EpsL
MSVVYRIVKPLFDRTVAAVALLVLSPLLLLAALLVRISMGAPVLFRQTRPGHRGKPFAFLKFRTMSNAVDERGAPLPDEQRLTRVGRLLRSTSLDELPQLINVLKGDMSLVGPRPLLMSYLERYSPEQMRRHDVLPGITGWAQVHGRNALPWAERLALDVWYVDHRSLAVDLRIIIKTIRAVVFREGISQPGHVTMTEFRGEREAPKDGNGG